MKDVNKITERIKKLLMKANSTNSAEEAETFLVKAQEMMVKYKIEQSQIEVDSEEEQIQEHEVEAGEVSLEGKWETILADDIAGYNGVKMLWTTNLRYKISFFGTEHDVMMTKYFFETARTAFRRLSREAYLERKKKVMEEHPSMSIKDLEFVGFLPYRSVFIRSFLHGACQGLEIKLHQMRREVVEKYDVNNAYGLIVRNQLEKADAYVLSKYKVKTNNGGGAFGDAEARNKGLNAGKNHQLTIGVEGTKSDRGLFLE